VFQHCDTYYNEKCTSMNITKPQKFQYLNSVKCSKRFRLHVIELRLSQNYYSLSDVAKYVEKENDRESGGILRMK